MESEEEARPAWQPLTPTGLAAFAGASLGRLWFIQLIVAFLAAATLVWFVSADWFPVFRSSIRLLPPRGRLAAGRLQWDGPPTALISENRYLACIIDLKHEGSARSPAHIQLEFGGSDIAILSLFGVLQLPYPRGCSIPFNRAELEPWWGAWSPFILAIIAAGVIAGLMVSWGLLATLYAGPAWLLGFFADRDLSLPGSWRLAGAALMPGALFMCAVVVVYGLGGMDVLMLIIAFGVHVLVDWVYLVLGTLWRPSHSKSTAQEQNPFRPPPAGEQP